MIGRVFAWLTDPANWQGSDGIAAQLGYHLLYTAIALAVALVIGFPLGVYIGHTGKGQTVLMGLANAARALPTLGLLILLVLLLAPVIKSNLAFTAPGLFVLVLLAIPPIISGTASGIGAIDRGTIDAARGMGCSEWRIILAVEIPCGVPLIFSGIRSGLLQIVSTATVAAYVSLNGLGRFILDGRATNNYPQIAGGAVLITVLAIGLELTFAGLQRLATSPGLLHQAA
ncbi:MAG: ABC transporter permease subunit [Bifidobacteriaceae bacterium]|jgi:osmoprotectant transport system permease protein|nr:ABC transporter permease subunit [Bifidobacteriaceae bacterium]